MKIVTKKYKNDSKRSLRKSKKLKKEMKNGSKPKFKRTQQNKSGGGSGFSSMVNDIFAGKFIRTDLNIRNAVNAWCEDPETAEIKYGHISGWNTSLVTNMSELFIGKTNFNVDINTKEVTKEDSPTGEAYTAWDVSQVTDMRAMFADAAAFNQPLEQWNVSQVTDMNSMFVGARAFNQDIGEWNVSNVTDMGYMFYNARAFNKPLANWERENSTVENSTVGNVTDMHSMFFGAAAFNQAIGQWNVSQVTTMSYMSVSYTHLTLPTNREV